jgi:hypothetical protein
MARLNRKKWTQLERMMEDSQFAMCNMFQSVPE